MTASTSSARPQELFRYSDVATRLDAELRSEANSLLSRLQRFEATCTEYRMCVSYLPGRIQGYASQADGTDRWVRRVGVGFLEADIFYGTWIAIAKSGKGFLDIVKDLAASRGKFRLALLTIGRLLNRIGGRGHVKWMDDIYRRLARGIPYRGDMDRFLKSDIFKNGLFIVSFILDVSEDVHKGEYDGDAPKIVGVNAISTGAELGIASTGYGAIVLLVNAAIQIVGNLQVGVQHTLAALVGGDHETTDLLLEDANRVEDAVGRMDLTNVIKELGEIAYDVYGVPYVSVGKALVGAIQQVWAQQDLNTLLSACQSVLEVQEKYGTDFILMVISPAVLLWTHRDILGEGLLDAGKATLNVVDGAVDWWLSSGFSFIDATMVITNQTVRSLPVSADFKSAVDSTLKYWLQRSQDNAEWVVKLWMP